MTKKIYLFVLFILTVWVVSPALAANFGGNEENPFTVIYDEGPVTAPLGQTLSQTVDIIIPENYYLYQEKTEIILNATDGLTVGKVIPSESSLKDDPFFGKTVPVYFNEAHLTLPIEIPAQAWEGTKKITGEIRFQGCSEELCYRPMKVPLEVTLAAPASSPAGEPAKGSEPKGGEGKGGWADFKARFEGADFSKLTEAGLGLALLIAFMGGVLTDFTPCVWPMIPVTLAIIGVRRNHRARDNFKAVGVLVLGMACMYSALGIAAAVLGKSLGFLFQSLFFLVLLEIVLVAMAFSLLGFYEIQLPASLQSKLASISATGYRGVFLIGLTMGLLAAPCVGPIVGPLLIYVAQTKDVGVGFLLLVAYALGMGTIFIVLGGFYGSLQGRLKSGPWSERIKKGIGVLMLLVAAYYGKTIYAQVAGPVGPQHAFWVHDLEAGLERAKAEGKPVLVDFYADWCPPCLELDRGAFSDPEVQARLGGDWVAIKVNCTEETPECAKAIERFRVIGWPTVVFLDRAQKEAALERLVGRVVDGDGMEAILNRVEDGNGP